MKTALSIIGWVAVAYVIFFFAWLMLGMGCMEAGHSAAECRDNTMSRVAETIYPLELIK